MIVGYDSDWDLTIFLEKEDIENLSHKKICGYLMKGNTLSPKPMRDVTLTLVDRVPSGGGGDVENLMGENILEIIINQGVLDDLNDTGRTGRRYGLVGRKLNFYDMSNENLNSDLKRIYQRMLEADS